MKEGPDIARIAALIGDPARANMLGALMDGRALTATELAHEAGVSKQTASSHLAQLHAGGLLGMEAQGRHRYFRLAGEEVSNALEALMGLASSSGAMRTRTGPRDPELRRARACYNHLAGEMGVALYARLTRKRWLQLDDEGAISLSPAGRRALVEFGVDMPGLEAQRRPLCRACLDWSERRHHLGGSLGEALLSRFAAIGWARREAGSRIVAFSPRGKSGLSSWIGLKA